MIKETDLEIGKRFRHGALFYEVIFVSDLNVVYKFGSDEKDLTLESIAEKLTFLNMVDSLDFQEETRVIRFRSNEGAVCLAIYGSTQYYHLYNSPEVFSPMDAV